MFHDLNIRYDRMHPEQTVETVKLAIKFGFNSIAVNLDIGDFEIISLEAKKKKQNRYAVIPQPFVVPKADIDRAISAAQAAKSKTFQFKIYSRVTAAIEETGSYHIFMKDAISKGYDLMAVRPKSELLLNAILNKPEIDILCFDPTDRPSWFSKSKQMQAAGNDNLLTFEISYKDALEDSSARRAVLSNARELWRVLRSKHLILSSGAEKPIQLRAPYDVANISILFGLTPDQGRKIITEYPHRAIVHAVSRKSVKGTMFVQSVDKASPSALEKLLNIPEFRAEVSKVVKTEANDSQSAESKHIKFESNSVEDAIVKRFNVDECQKITTMQEDDSPKKKKVKKL